MEVFFHVIAFLRWRAWLVSRVKAGMVAQNGRRAALARVLL
jgi:hypothetical protein